MLERRLPIATYKEFCGNSEQPWVTLDQRGSGLDTTGDHP